MRRKDLSLRQEGGFTLVELMVVLLVIGILISIGLPAFLGAKARAQDRHAQADLHSGLLAAATYASAPRLSFIGFDTGCGAAPDSCTEADAAEPSLAWVGGDPQTGQISVSYVDATSVVLVVHSETDTYFCLAQSNGGESFGRGVAFADIDQLAECAGGW